MYRDGGLIPGDGDIDVQYRVKYPLDKSELKRLLSLESLSSSEYHLSLQGGLKDGFRDGFRDVETFEAEKPRNIGEGLCKPARCPLQTRKDARAYLELNYGPHWFVKMPWKCQKPGFFFEWSRPHLWAKQNKKSPNMFFVGKWRNSVKVVQSMDTNNDGVISTQEIDDRVMADGIDVAEYRRQITSRDKCRAAAMLTWILEYDKNPFDISDGNSRHELQGKHPIFRFLDEKCDVF